MSNRKCFISKYKNYNSYNLYYKGVQVHISFQTLQHIIKILNQFDSLDEQTKQDKPLRIKINPVVLTVPNSDYFEFKSVLENAAVENYQLTNFNNYKIFTN